MTLNDAIDSQLESPFFSKLPLELRGSIYRFAFDVEDVVS